ncbi:MAG: hypothetical protein COV73_04445 [Candidatus Omnitrophica bacterium CG11_big_fil_rev_8_21_14_0_20_43_6]|nr:MAG: hypothetical protein COV73_04445 [Candidatus Omnitrophica bacterium CG11_big_fil_rev_8_21_14_0_20_43_6]
MKKRKFNFPVQIISGLVIISLAFFFIIGYIWKVLTTADFFAVKQVVVRNSDYQLEYLKGRNIFSLNLGYEAKRAYLSCPDCSKVRFARILPNCIVVDFLKRKPVAWVKFYKIFAIDDHGVLFYPDEAAEGLELPVIYGLETKIFAPKPGRSYRRPEINLALNIIKGFKDNKSFGGFTLKRVDVADPDSAGFFLILPPQISNFVAGKQPEERGFQVHSGLNNISQKMMILGGLLIQERKEWANIKYIDLRFKEPLIKFNNVK